MKSKLVKYPFNDGKRYRWDTYKMGKRFEYSWDRSPSANYTTMNPYIEAEPFDYSTIGNEDFVYLDLSTTDRENWITNYDAEYGGKWAANENPQWDYYNYTLNSSSDTWNYIDHRYYSSINVWPGLIYSNKKHKNISFDDFTMDEDEWIAVQTLSSPNHLSGLTQEEFEWYCNNDFDVNKLVSRLLTTNASGISNVLSFYCNVNCYAGDYVIDRNNLDNIKFKYDIELDEYNRKQIIVSCNVSNMKWYSNINNGNGSHINVSYVKLNSEGGGFRDYIGSPIPPTWLNVTDTYLITSNDDIKNSILPYQYRNKVIFTFIDTRSDVFRCEGYTYQIPENRNGLLFFSQSGWDEGISITYLGRSDIGYTAEGATTPRAPFCIANSPFEVMSRNQLHWDNPEVRAQYENATD